jgi:hypothetical protein
MAVGCPKVLWEAFGSEFLYWLLQLWPIALTHLLWSGQLLIECLFKTKKNWGVGDYNCWLKGRFLSMFWRVGDMAQHFWEQRKMSPPQNATLQLWTSPILFLAANTKCSSGSNNHFDLIVLLLLVGSKVSVYLGLPSTEYFWFRVQLSNLELGEIDWGKL